MITSPVQKATHYLPTAWFFCAEWAFTQISLMNKAAQIKHRQCRPFKSDFKLSFHVSFKRKEHMMQLSFYAFTLK
jgi:hypothetical protein